MIEVSIVIVCMNNLENLYPCLDSIRNNTFINYETLVVTYLFSEDNLQKLKSEYPWITIIESNEIRGFSENNNLALRQAKGQYCFVLNDDTYFDIPVIDLLVDSMEKIPEASIFSPKILRIDGSVQCCGRPPLNFYTYCLSRFKLWNENKVKSKYTNKKGVFQTFNILGAAFMIKSDVFLKLGFFDEFYFFSPEDIALSTLANRNGYKCYINESVALYHMEGGTKKTSKISLATKPAGTKGNINFYADGSILRKIALIFFVTLETIGKLSYWLLKYIFDPDKSKIMIISYLNIFLAIYSNKNPKQLFLHFYKKSVKNGLLLSNKI